MNIKQADARREKQKIPRIILIMMLLLLVLGLLELNVIAAKDILILDELFFPMQPVYANENQLDSMGYITLREVKKEYNIESSLNLKTTIEKSMILPSPIKDRVTITKQTVGKMEKAKRSSPNYKIKQNHVYHIEDYVFSDHSETKYTMENFKGKIIILYFWASWSIDSISGLRELCKLAAKLKSDKIDDILIFPISMDSKGRDDIEKIYRKNGIKNIPLLFDATKAANDLFHINMPPTAFIVDKNCKIEERFNISPAWNSEIVYKALLEIKDGKTINIKAKLDMGKKPESHNILVNGMYFKNKDSDSGIMILK